MIIFLLCFISLCSRKPSRQSSVSNEMYSAVRMHSYVCTCQNNAERCAYWLKKTAWAVGFFLFMVAKGTAPFIIISMIP